MNNKKLKYNIILMMDGLANILHGNFGDSISENKQKFVTMHECLSDIGKSIGIDVSLAKDIYDDEVFPDNQSENQQYKQLNLFDQEDVGDNIKNGTKTTPKELRNGCSNRKNIRINKTGGILIKKRKWNTVHAKAVKRKKK